MYLNKVKEGQPISI